MSVKINKKTLEMEEDERFDNISLEELAEGSSFSKPLSCQPSHFLSISSPSIPRPELPENSPRYVVLSYELKFSDGRISYPLVLISWAP